MNNSTIKDVAKVSGYSVATVSRAINKSGYVSEKAKDKIMKACIELDYIPNFSAQMMRTNKSNIIALIIINLDNSYFVELASTIDKVCLEKGYRLILCNVDEDLEKEKSYIELIKNLNIDGVLIAGGEREYDELHNIPTVMLDRVGEDTVSRPSVTSDNEKGAYLATSHLINKGCKNLLYLGPKNDNYTSNIRSNTFKNTCHKLHVNESQINIDSLEDFKKIDFNNYDGVFAWNDELAIDLIFHLIKNNYKIPNDICIVGFDNNILSRRIVPSLTTIDQGYEIMARKSVELLIKYVNDPTAPVEHIVLPTRLIERNSTERRQ